MAPCARLPQTERSFIVNIGVALLNVFTLIYTTLRKLLRWEDSDGVHTRQIDKQSSQPREEEGHYSPNGDIEKKVPVENDCFVDNDHHKPQPKSLQRPGGSDSNTTTNKKETAVKESTCSQSSTVSPSHGTANGGENGGGDSDPPKKTRPDENKGHYLGKGAVSLKTEVPHPESCGASNGTASENQSEDQQLQENQPSEELACDTPSLSTTRQLDSDGDDGNVSLIHWLRQKFQNIFPWFNQKKRVEWNVKNETPYEILHQFQGGINIGDDGFYKPNRDYKIIKKIGTGGFGTVFKVRDQKSGDKFALKQVPCKLFNPDELEIWSNLSPHECVVTLLGAYSNGKHVHMFMELMDCSLQFIAENRKELRITERKVAAIMTPVLKFLGFMHGKGYVYVDMKLENILVSRLAIKGSDFGISIRCGTGFDKESDIKQTGEVMQYLLNGIPLWEEEVDVFNNCSNEMKTLLNCMWDPVKENRPTANELIDRPFFRDTPGSVLHDLLVDVQRCIEKSSAHPL